jgi:hypothetical protein
VLCILGSHINHFVSLQLLPKGLHYVHHFGSFAPAAPLVQTAPLASSGSN